MKTKKKPMQIEYYDCRTVGLLIDGQQPLVGNDGWSVGQTDDERGWTCQTNYPESKPLPFKTAWGSMGVTEIRFDHQGYDDQVCPNDPKEIRLTLEDGTVLKGKVTKVVVGDPEKAPKKVKMVSGDKLEVDEITIYVRAEVK